MGIFLGGRREGFVGVVRVDGKGRERGMLWGEMA